MAGSAGKVALITGVTGQDGAYLAELLLAKGYAVHGMKRRSSSFNTARHRPSLSRSARRPASPSFLHYGDMTDATNLIRIVQETQPDEIYNLAAQSHVQVQLRDARIHRECRRARHAAPARGDPHPRTARSKTRFYQASTSELLRQGAGDAAERDDAVLSALPYGGAKLYAYWITVNYREAYGMHASNGILFNHESPMRGETFVTRKITRAVAAIKLGLQEQAVSRQSRCRARLGPRARLCRGHVADAAAGRARRLRAGDRREPHRARVRREGLRPYRPPHRLARQRHG